MKSSLLSLFAFVVSFARLTTAKAAIQMNEIIPFGSSWQWLHPTNGVDPATNLPNFHSTWMTSGGAAFPSMGNAPLGYGTIDYTALSTNIGTPPSGSRYTAYFRKTFTLTATASQLYVEILADDGAFVYVDGQLVGSVNVPAQDGYGVLAADNNDTEARLFIVRIAGGNFSSGSHTIGVSIHNAEATSTDLGFDLRLYTAIQTSGGKQTWSVNGHQYEAVWSPAGIDWNDASAAAEALGGNLVTVSSAAENSFVSGLIQTSAFWYRRTYLGQPIEYVGPWIGAEQGVASTPSEGWGWITGDTFNYTNWLSGEPDDNGGVENGQENVAAFRGSSPGASTWCDAGENSLKSGYIIEYEPGPGSFTLSNLAPVCDTNPPPAPALRLNWTASSLATTYDLFRNGALYKAGLTGTTFYNSLGLLEGQTYTYTVVARNPGGTRDSNTITVPIPAGLCGTFGTPRIDRVTPNSVIGSDSRQTITMDGAFFDPGCAVHLTCTGENDYVVPSSRVTRVSNTRVTMSITTTTEPDNWTVEVVNPNGLRSGPKPFSVIGATRALQPTAVSFSPATVTAGTTFNVTFSIKNIGTETSPATTAKVQVSSDATFTSSDPVVLPASISIPSLNSGQSTGGTLAFTVPASLAGNYYVALSADAGRVFNPAGFNGGTLPATSRLSVLQSGNGSPLRVVVSPPEGTLTSAAGPLSIRIINTGSALMSFTATPPAVPWLTASPQNPAGPVPVGDEITLRYNATTNPGPTGRGTSLQIAATSHPGSPVPVPVTQLAPTAVLPRLQFGQIGTVIAGQPVNVTVTAKNADGTTDTSVSGPASLSIAGASNVTVSPPSITLENGTGQASLAFDLPGRALSLQASKTGTGGGSSGSFDVLATSSGSAVLKVKVLSEEDGTPVNGATVKCSGLRVVPDLVPPAMRLESYTVSGVTENGEAELDVYPGRSTVTASLTTAMGTTESLPVIRNNRLLPQDNFESLKMFAVRMPAGSKQAVLLVPGMLGSRGFLNQGNLYPTLPNVARPAPASQLEIFGKTVISNWNNLRRSLNSAGFTVYDVPWDWRMSVTEADAVANKTAWEEYLLPMIRHAKNDSGDEKVSIVAHSLGGLLVRGYTASGVYGDDIEKVAFVGTPHRGALAPYYLWFGGDFDGADDVSDSRTYSLAAENLYEQIYGARAVLGWNPLWEFTGNATKREFVREHIPSVKEGLPTFPFLQRSPNGFPVRYWEAMIIGNDPDSRREPPLEVLNNRPLRQSARSILTRSFVSNKLQTPAKLVVSSGNQRLARDRHGTLYPHGDPTEMVENQLGDGTVTAQSAGYRWSGLETETLRVDGIESTDFGEHSKEPGDSDTIDFVRSFLAGPAGVRSPRGNPPAPVETVVVAVAGNATLLVEPPDGGQIGTELTTGSSVNTVADGESHADADYSLVSVVNTQPGICLMRFQAALGLPLEVSASVDWQGSNYTYSRKWIGVGTPCEIRIGLPAAGAGAVYFGDTPGYVESLEATASGEGTSLAWPTPGEQATAYKVFGRPGADETFQLLTTTAALNYTTTHPWDATGAEAWQYQVVPVAADGRAGPASNTARNQTMHAAWMGFPDGAPIAPATVTLRDESLGGPFAWEWDFNGDGATDSTEQHPAAVFAIAAIYSVSLKVRYPDGSELTAGPQDLLIAPVAGSVRIDFGTEVERPAGGGWKLNVESVWRGSGELADGVPYGRHQLHFLPVPGWMAPEDMSLEIAPEEPMQMLGLRYTRISETYEEWQTREFGTDAGNVAIGGETADPDRDGLTNLIEYATATNPRQPQSGEILTAVADAVNPDNLVLSFPRNLKAEPGLLVTLEDSTDLVVWAPIIEAEAPQTLLSEHVSRVSLSLSRSSPRKYYQLRVVRE